MFSVDEVQNEAMKKKRLRSRAPPSRRPLSSEDPIRDDGVPPSSTMIGQPIVQPPARASTSTPTTTLMIAKSKKIPYTKPGVGKCYMCDESGHRSNEYPKRRLVNMIDYRGKMMC